MIPPSDIVVVMVIMGVDWEGFLLSAWISIWIVTEAPGKERL